MQAEFAHDGLAGGTGDGSNRRRGSRPRAGRASAAAGRLAGSALALGVLCGGCGGQAQTGDAGTDPLCAPGNVPALIAQLQGGDSAVADQAYRSLYCSGLDAIDALLVLGDSTATYAGSTYLNPVSSTRSMAAPLLAEVALYLAEGIRVGEMTPYSLPRLGSVPLQAESALLPVAVQRYRSWWSANRGKSQAELATLDPLKAADQALMIFWEGNPAALPQSPTDTSCSDPARQACKVIGDACSVADGRPFQRDEAGPITLIKLDPAACTFMPAEYSWIYAPKDPGAHVPYNCLAWALGKDDRWINPTGQVSWDQVLVREGYSHDEMACTGCPSGTGPMIMLVWDCNNEWQHALRLEAGGTWTSKNGQCYLYEGIEQGALESFLCDFYGPHRSRCFCKNPDPIPPPPPIGGVSVGDPHLTTFDGLHYDLQAVGELTLALDPTDQAEVQVRTAPWPARSDVATNVAVAARVGSDTVAVYADGTLRINHAVATLAGGSRQALGGGTLYHTSGSYVAVWPDNTQLWIQSLGPSLSVRLAPSAARRRKLTGLLGNFDGDLANELATRDGVVLARPMSAAVLYGSFAESWRVAQASSLFDYAPGQTTETFTDRSFPHRLVSTRDLSDAARAVATATCQAALVPPQWLDDCVLDVGLTGNASLAGGFAALPAPLAPGDIDSPARALTGATATLSVRYPTLDKPISRSLSAPVGPDLEFPSIQSAALPGNTVIPADIDVGASTIDIHYRATSAVPAAGFNGYVVSFAGAGLPVIRGVAIDPASTPDLRGALVAFDTKRVFIHVGGAQVTPSSRLLIDLRLGDDLCARNPGAASWDSAADFSTLENPCGVWSYGYTRTLGSTPLVPFSGTAAVSATTAALFWYDPANVTLNAPNLGINPAPGTSLVGVLPGQSWQHPGPHGEYATTRWTAPRAGTYAIHARFFTGDTGETDGAVLRGTTVLFEHATSSNPAYSTTLALQAGETIDVAVGLAGTETYFFGTTPVVFTVTAQ